MSWHFLILSDLQIAIVTQQSRAQTTNTRLKVKTTRRTSILFSTDNMQGSTLTKKKSP